MRLLDLLLNLDTATNTVTILVLVQPLKHQMLTNTSQLRPPQKLNILLGNRLQHVLI